MESAMSASSSPGFCSIVRVSAYDWVSWGMNLTLAVRRLGKSIDIYPQTMERGPDAEWPIRMTHVYYVGIS